MQVYAVKIIKKEKGGIAVLLSNGDLLIGIKKVSVKAFSNEDFETMFIEAYTEKQEK
jgi:exosome complex RNA-binding protein Rrp42 (RNase PH superfamily)